TAPSAAGQALPLTAAPIDLVDDGSIAAEPLQHPPAPEPKPAPPTAPAPPLSAAASAEGPSVHAARASAPPSIDGKLDDAVWSSASSRAPAPRIKCKHGATSRPDRRSTRGRIFPPARALKYRATGDSWVSRGSITIARSSSRPSCSPEPSTGLPIPHSCAAAG